VPQERRPKAGVPPPPRGRRSPQAPAAAGGCGGSRAGGRSPQTWRRGDLGLSLTEARGSHRDEGGPQDPASDRAASASASDDLGQDPQEPTDELRTVTTRRYNRVSETVETREFETRPRPYILLSLATHAQPGGPPTWHRLVVWNGDLLCHRNIRFLGKGDKIQVRTHGWFHQPLSSRREVQVPGLPRTRWSRSSTPTSSAAAAMRRVKLRSSPLGVGSPLG
jgi:hypothetical protein